MRESGHCDGAAALTTGFDIDVEHPLEAQRPLARTSRCREAQVCESGQVIAARRLAGV
jgi:hypothetical protein